jgi:hypothetical protein
VEMASRRRAAVVAGAVQPFVVGAGEQAEVAEPGAPRQDPLAEVGVEPDLLPRVGAERPGVVPDPGGHADPTHVLDERGPPDGVGLRPAQPAGEAASRARAATLGERPRVHGL